MKRLKQFFTALMAAVTVLAIGSTAFAQTVDSQKGGAGTITVSNASQGQTYTIYKLFDATVTADGSGISYKLPAGKTAANFGGDAWFDVDSKGNVTAKENADVSTDAFKAWAQANGEEIASAEAADNTLVFTNVPYGYYFVESSLGATISVDSTTPDVSLIDKNDTKPSIPDDVDGGGKKIVTDGNTTADSTTAKIGDTVNFQIKFNATNYVTENKTTKQIVSYTITDTPTALAINQDSVQVTVGGQSITANVSKTFDAAGNMTLVLTWADAADNNKTIYKSPSEVIITYSAIVTKDAKDGQASNSATIGYNTVDDPTTPPTPVDPDNPTDTTTVTTHRFTLNKTNEANEKLSGAEFKLYDAQTGGNEIKVVKDGNEYRVAEANETGVVIEAGEVVIKGLKHSTTYYLEEIKAPDGYNILTARQAIEVKEDNSAVANVINKSGAELPSTGAFGTTLFYLLGSVLLLGVLVYSISKRRMKNM